MIFHRFHNNKVSHLYVFFHAWPVYGIVRMFSTGITTSQHYCLTSECVLSWSLRVPDCANDFPQVLQVCIRFHTSM